MDVSDIKFLQAGGTIDKQYLAGADHHGLNFEIGRPAFIPILTRLGVSPNTIDYSVACRKDSLFVDQNDRNAILARAIATSRQRIVATHGTDTIHLTASYVANNIHLEKIIVFTGSLLPEAFKDSDADFNLGMAITAVRILSPGVYIALYGEVKPWHAFKPR